MRRINIPATQVMNRGRPAADARGGSEVSRRTAAAAAVIIFIFVSAPAIASTPTHLHRRGCMLCAALYTRVLD